MNKKLGHNVNAVTAPTFIKDTVEKTGVSARKIEEEIQIASRLSDEEKKIFIGYLRDIFRNC
jgi:hypothetical protein